VRPIWGYARVSTEKEAQELSLADQERWVLEHARTNDAEVEVFKEQASAKSVLGRPVFAGMLKRLEELPAARRPQQIAVVAFDRLSRDLTDSLVVARTLRRLKVDLYVRDAGGLVRAETFGDKLQVIGRGIAAEGENAERSDRLRASWERRRREGKPGSNRAPYALQMAAERDVPADGDAPAWVLRAFEAYAQGTGTHTIARTLREEGPPHYVRTSRIGPDGAPIVKIKVPIWTFPAVQKMLRQRRYRDVIVPGDVFDFVQARLDSKPNARRERVHAYPLSSAIRCAKCGRAFHGRAITPGKRVTLASGEAKLYKATTPIRYYECNSVGCGVRINAEKLELQFRQEVSRLSADPKLVDRWLRAESKDTGVRAVRTEITALERSTAPDALEAARQRIWDVAMAAGPNASRDLEKQLGRIQTKADVERTRLAELRTSLEKRSTVERTADEAQKLLAGFWRRYDRSTTTYEKKRQLLDLLTAALGGCTADREGLYWVRNRKTPAQPATISRLRKHLSR
jgi:DNA invertase Pin-like site-specific DNA recombinase